LNFAHIESFAVCVRRQQGTVLVLLKREVFLLVADVDSSLGVASSELS